MNNHLKNSLIIVESPLQLLCAFEAVHYFDVNSEYYIRLSNNEINNLQMKQIVKDLNIQNITYLPLPAEKDFITIMSMLKYLVKMKMKNYDYYILGDYLSGFIQQFIKISLKKKIILVDDGVATFKIQRLLQNKTLPLTLYTMFISKKLDNQKIFINKFATLKKKYNKISKSADIFIGGKLVDLDIVSMDTYIKVLKHAINKSIGNKILYFPHRGASKKVIEEIASLENLEIIYPDTTVEFYLLREGIKAKNIYSILSTALFSLAILYDDSNIIAYKPLFKNNERERDIEQLYIQLASSDKIKVISIT